MKIRRIAAYSVTLPLVRGTYTMSHGRSASAWETTVVRVETDTGLVGYGEACPAGGSYLEGSPGSIQAGVRELAPLLLGLDPSASAVINARMDGVLQGNAPAKSPIDIACLDIRGHATGLPIHALLGGAFQAELPVFDAISLASPEEMGAYAATMRSAGYRHYQLKLGGDPDEDRARIEAVMAAAGSWAFMTCDANAGWTRAEAARVARAIDALDVYLEQPCPSLAEVADVRARSHLPVIVDELVTGAAALVEIVSARAADAINLKLTRVGGLTRAAQVRDLAQALNLPLLVDEPGGADLASAAMIQLAASTRPEYLIAQSMAATTVRLVGDTIPTVRNGRVRVPDGPGLGVAVDESQLGAPLFEIS